MSIKHAWWYISKQTRVMNMYYRAQTIHMRSLQPRVAQYRISRVRQTRVRTWVTLQNKGSTSISPFLDDTTAFLSSKLCSIDGNALLPRCFSMALLFLRWSREFIHWPYTSVSDTDMSKCINIWFQKHLLLSLLEVVCDARIGFVSLGCEARVAVFSTLVH